MEPTKAQKKAIESHEGQYLVAAGAGSGKTAVLSKRAASIIKSGKCRIEELLVLTFGNDAAAEMKGRILKELNEQGDDPLCQEAAHRIDSAAVMTFDALAYRLVSQYSHLLPVPPSISIDGSGLLDLERRRLLKAYSEELAANKDERYLSLLRRYCLKSDDVLTDYVLAIDEAARLSPDPEKWLKEARTRFFEPDFLEARYRVLVEAAIKRLKNIIDKVPFLLDEPYKSSVIDNCEQKIMAYMGSAEEGLAFKTKFKKVSDKSPLTEEEKKVYKAVRNKANDADAECKAVGKSEEAIKKSLAQRDDISFFLDLALRLRKDMAEKMYSSGVYGFSDIYNLALKALDYPEIKADFAGKYKYAMVDEYQDTSDLQQSFLARLNIKNVFCVGDVKQSIYGFRHANPSIFSALRERYEDRGEGELIRLKENFRSRSEVLEGINRLFNGLMTKDLGGVDYQKGEALNYGNTGYDAANGLEDYGFKMVKLDPTGTNYKVPSAHYIANDIAKKLSEGFKIYDLKAKKGEEKIRPCRPRDFAILCMTRGTYKEFAKELSDKKIPFVLDQGEELKNADVLMVLSSLARFYLLLGDKRRRKELSHAYVSIRRSFLYMDSDQKIYEDLQNGAYLEGEFVKDAINNRLDVLNASLPHAVNFFLSHYPFRDGILRVRHTKNVMKLIQGLTASAENMERLGYDLAYLADYPENLARFKIKAEAELPPMDEDCVHLYSIHRSKGLQFPIVYIPDLEHGFNLQDTKTAFLADTDLGLSLKLRDKKPEKKKTVQTLAYGLTKKKEAISEYMRLFYVGVTRAEQVIYLVETENGKDYDGLGDPLSFRAFLALSGFDEDLEPISLYRLKEYAYRAGGEKEGEIPSPLEFVEPKIMDPVPERKRPSKDSLFVDEAASEYGTLLHAYMEMVDFSDPDLSFIKDEKIRTKLEKVLALEIFQKTKGYKAYKEYNYVSEDGTRGSIDLLLVGQDDCVVIDYKAKNILDPAYITQVNTYCQYVEKAFGKKTRGYLLSLSNALCRVVD